MNYRHIFHAGNFADVFKHSVLCLIIHALQKKENGITFIDTHAGIGLYDLESKAAKQNPEYLRGIYPLIKKNENKSTPQVLSINLYLDFINSLQSAIKSNLKIYPGSGMIFKNFLRPQDKLILNELHPDDYLLLKRQIRGAQIHIHKRDAYEFLLAMLPPTPRRALILIDPPFEDKDEFAKLVELIKKAYKSYSQATYLIWYPIVHKEHEKFLLNIKHSNLEQIFNVEIILNKNFDKEQNGLRGAGMLIINPPYDAEKDIIALTKYLENFYKNLR